MSSLARTVCAFHGCPRYTGDLEILIRPSPENATKIIPLLRDFGFGADDFTEPEQIIQIGRVPQRIDLLTSLSGVETDEAFQTKISSDLEGLPVSLLSRELLIQNKRAVGRPQDIADLHALEE